MLGLGSVTLTSGNGKVPGGWAGGGSSEGGTATLITPAGTHIGIPSGITGGSTSKTFTTNGSEPTYTIGLEETTANITATSMSVTPRESPCRYGICIVDISVTWTNSGGAGTFIPSIFVDSTKYSLTQIPISAGGTVAQAFVVSGLSVGPHTICPDPN